MGDCNCGGCACNDIKAETNSYQYATKEEALKVSKELGCEGFHTMEVEGKTLFMPCDSHATYEEVIESAYNSCGIDEELRDGKCVKVAFEIDIDITVDDVVMQADTGEYIISISGVAFHQGVNKNGWELTRAGASLAVSQMVGADLTLNHPKSENGRFTRNMDGGVDEAVVGFITEATTVDKIGGDWEVRFKAEVHRSELFEALESGLWLREGYGVSIGGMGIPDEMIESEDGTYIMRFETDFELDHLAIVHRPAYSGARIESIQRVNLAESSESFNSQPHSVPNIAKECNVMSDEEIIVASEEEVIETPVLEEIAEATEEVTTPDYAAEIEALKASLAERDEQLNAIKVAEEAHAENARLSLVEKATEMGIAGVADLSAETISTIMASFEAVKPIEVTPVKEMTPVASNVEATVKTSVESEEVVANYLNRKLVKTPVSLYAKAWNAWAGAWNQTLSASERQSSGAPTFEEARSKNLI